jgi:hypothetical protein
MKIKQLNELASTMVGDGDSPDVFFVTDKNGDVAMITVDFERAYSFWNDLPKTEQSTLENRKWGVICSTEPRNENDSRLVTMDDATEFRKYLKPETILR